MSLAHAGVGVLVIGVSLVSAFGVDRDLSLNEGETATAAGYEFRFLGVSEEQGPNYVAQIGQIALFDDGRRIATLEPEKRRYPARGNVMTESSVDVSVFRDVYVSLGEPLESGGWSLHAFYRPFVRWIWAGGALMMLGGILAASDPRYRKQRARERVADQQSAEVAAGT